MAIASSDPSGVQRGRGGFMRGSNDVPYITDPDGGTVKTGPRKGQPKRVPYGSPSNRGKQIENGTNLVKWGERRVVLGIAAAVTAQQHELIAQLAALTDLEVDSDDYKVAADAVILRAKETAGAFLAANVGTFVHALTEDHDEDRDWVQRAEAGELLGVPLEIQAQVVDAWKATICEHFGLEQLAVEASCVDDRWRLAGTLDRIVRLTRDLEVTGFDGRRQFIPAGTVLVLDVKTSNKRADREGRPQWWNAYGIQIASYAQSVPYDTETETRGEWPWPIDQDHALIARPNVVEVLAGEADRIEWELIHVDLRSAREHGGECVSAAKAWEARKDLFSAAVAVADTPTVQIATDTVAPPTVVAEAPSAAEATPAAPAAPAPTLTPAEQHARLTEQPDEGGPISDADYNALRRHYEALPKAVLDACYTPVVEDAMRNRVSFHLSKARTVRRYEIARGLVVLAQHDTLDEDTLRGLLAAEDLLGEVAEFPAVTPGHLVGSLDAERAALFAQRCHALVDGALVTTYRPDGSASISLHPAA
jgi:hypothetical protein